DRKGASRWRGAGIARPVRFGRGKRGSDPDPPRRFTEVSDLGPLFAAKPDVRNRLARPGRERFRLSPPILWVWTQLASGPPLVVRKLLDVPGRTQLPSPRHPRIVHPDGIRPIGGTPVAAQKRR